MTTPRTIGYVQVGGTNSTGYNRSVEAPELKPKGAGWDAYVARYIVPRLSLKLDALALWSPFGVRRDEPLQADAVLEAKNYPKLVKGFSEAWAPICKEVEVIGYGGALSLDDSFRGLSAHLWLARAVSSYAPYLDAGMSLAFDASAGPINRGQVDEEMRVRAAGFIDVMRTIYARPIYCEPWWLEGADWAATYPVFVTDSFYNTIKTQNFVGYRKPFSTMPEVIRILDHAPVKSGRWEDVTPADIRQWIDGVHAEGHSVAVGIDSLAMGVA